MWLNAPGSRSRWVLCDCQGLSIEPMRLVFRVAIALRLVRCGSMRPGHDRVEPGAIVRVYQSSRCAKLHRLPRGRRRPDVVSVAIASRRAWCDREGVPIEPTCKVAMGSCTGGQPSARVGVGVPVVGIVAVVIATVAIVTIVYLVTL